MQTTDQLDEIWDIYDDKRQLQGYTKRRGDELVAGEYHLVINAVIFNAQREILVQQRSLRKLKFPGIWEPLAGGSALAGETSVAAMQREVREELGVVLPFSPADYVMTFVGENWFDDVYAVQFDGELADFTRQESEVAALKFMNFDDVVALMAEQKMGHYDEILQPAYDHVFGAKKEQ
ncbi:MAG TPA: NUDIX domain-containing protein [Lactobacillaceae bacterium]|jgi:isopentenyldiphosphate isomerase